MLALKTFTVNIVMKWIAAKIKKARKVSERLRPTSNYENRICFKLEFKSKKLL